MNKTLYTTHVPFARIGYRRIPKTPRLPHSYASTVAHEVMVETAEFGTTRCHYRTVGDGPALLLVHGLMTTSYSWRYILRTWGARFRLYIPDLPGAGRSDKPLGSRYSATALATWLGAFQTAVGIRGCDVVGNSMGGYIAMQLALRDPAAMRSLVNIHSPGLPHWRYTLLARALSLPGVSQGLARFVQTTALPWVYYNVHYHDDSLKSVEELHEYGDPLATTEGSRAFVHYLSDTFAPEELATFSATLTARRAAGHPFPVPLLLLYSETDPLVPPAVGSALHALIPGSKLVWVSGTSHFAHVDTPELITPHVLQFLEQQAQTL